MPAASSYRPLGDYLLSRPLPAETLLTLAAIERLLGRPLPPSAQHVSFWTARSSTGLGRSLRRAGCRADLVVTPEGLAVRFTRAPARTTRRARAGAPRTPLAAFATRTEVA